MASHRYIWAATAFAVAIALGVMAWRTVDVGGHDQRVDHMLKLLDQDPQARRDATRTAVDAVIRGATGSDRETAEMYYALSLKAHGRKHYEEAAHLLRAAITIRPDWALAHNNLGITLYSDRKIEEAKESFLTAISLAPRWSRPYNDLAIVYRRTGKLTEAKELAEMAKALEPNSVDVLNNYGNLLVRLDDFEGARRQYEEAAALDPSHAWPQYNLACLHAIQGDRALALKHLEEALRLHPEFLEDALTDKDLTSIREDPEFQAILARYQ